MLRSTLPYLCCPIPQCAGSLSLEVGREAGDELNGDVLYGSLTCSKCKEAYLILAGVALLLEETEAYLFNHVKGISKFVPDHKIPEAYRNVYLSAKAEISEDHIEEDLESERVNALYLASHYLSANSVGENANWWKPRNSSVDPVMDALIQKHWDHGPFSVVEKWLEKATRGAQASPSILELGCGVGGLCRKIPASTKQYIGVDYAFAGIALARHLNLGAPYRSDLKIPEDLFQGATSRPVHLEEKTKMKVDFIAADVAQVPMVKGGWDICVVLNAIDMLDEPRLLPETQFSFLKKGGLAIQTCPYIWHEKVAKKLRNALPKAVTNSAEAVKTLYVKAGFKIVDEQDHIPWIFFKHVRQLEVYSVHAFTAMK